MPEPMIVWFKDLGLEDLPTVGGKNASLGELISLEGVEVPNGFAITTAAWEHFIKPLKPRIAKLIADLAVTDYRDTNLLDRTSREIRMMIENHAFDREFECLVAEGFKDLDPQRNVAVRSSATAEDLPEASFAGQQDTFLNVSSLADLLDKVKRCFSSLYTARAMSYRHHNSFPEEGVALSVGIQEMVRADWNGVSGVLFTIDTETGNQNLILITPHKGLGEAIVQGEVKPDEVYVLRHSYKVIQNPLGLLPDSVYSDLARQSLSIESHYRRKYGRRMYMDIEWAMDGETKEVFILQARPETIHSRDCPNTRSRRSASPICRGRRPKLCSTSALRSTLFPLPSSRTTGSASPASSSSSLPISASIRCTCSSSERSRNLSTSWWQASAASPEPSIRHR